MTTPAGWRSRIVGEEDVAPDQLLANPRNWRVHPRRQQQALAGALDQVGWVQRVIVNRVTGHLVDGHLRVELALRRGEPTLPVSYVELSPEEEGLIVASLDPLAAMAEQDDEKLRQLLAEIEVDSAELKAALDSMATLTLAGNADADDVPAVREDDVWVKPGEVWHLGAHRIMCGDSTRADDVARLVAGETLTMIHADPPYGMGKEAEGVANDNLYGSKLDGFQMSWYGAWSPILSDVGSLYIWGQAPDLWRLWWSGGLADVGDLLYRNEIVWDKGLVQGMGAAGAHSYPPATERCLFLMRGRQFLGNMSVADYWEGYEPLRSWLDEERQRMGWQLRDVNAVTGTTMAGHWFTRSQFQPIAEKHYRKLQDAAAGAAFAEPYRALFARLFPDLDGDPNAYRRSLGAELRERRTYFDNTHADMTDVWQFPRVRGEERFGHATPKPVAMVERAIRSSSRAGDAIGAPFSGTGPEIIAAERLGRRCYSMELEPRYVQIAVERWQNYTGKTATRG